jgi:tetratricopeptide (TPR) repeat protein
VAAFEQSDYEAARRLTETSLAVFRQLRDTNGMATALLNLGNTALDSGQLEAARGYFDEAIVLERSLAGGTAATPLGGLGRVLRQLGDLKGARACFAESLQLRLQSGERRGVAVTLTNIAYLEHDAHRPDRAARLLAAADTLRAAIGAPILPGRRAEYEQLVAGLQAALGEEGWSTLKVPTCSLRRRSEHPQIRGCPGRALGEPGFGDLEMVLIPDQPNPVAGLENGPGFRVGQQAPVAEDGHHRSPGLGPQIGVGQRPAD